MRIIIAITIFIICLAAIAIWLFGGQTYSFVRQEVAGDLMSELTEINQHLDFDLFVMFADSIDSGGAGIFRIEAANSTFNGELIIFIGNGILFRGYLYHYWIWGNRLSFDLWIDTPYGRLVVDNMWE